MEKKKHENISEIKAIDRLKELERSISVEFLAFKFARELVHSAIAAYGRPLIDLDDAQSIIFEWKTMFWLVNNDGNRVTVVINDEPKTAKTFYRNDLRAFMDDPTNIPAGMPFIGNQSEFENGEK